MIDQFKNDFLQLMNPIPITLSKTSPLESSISIDREKLDQSVGRKGYTVEELKQFLRQLNLKISGNKTELTERLKPYSK